VGQQHLATLPFQIEFDQFPKLTIIVHHKDFWFHCRKSFLLMCRSDAELVKRLWQFLSGLGRDGLLWQFLQEQFVRITGE
jgi:hypothetical protein